MTFNKRPQVKRLISAVIVGTSLLVGPNLFAGQAPKKSTITHPGAEAKILSSRDFRGLRRDLPEISKQLKSMNPYKLHSTYEKTRRHMISLMQETRDQLNIGYVDDLKFIAKAMSETESKDEKMALIFLSLPRLFERAVVMPGDDYEHESMRRTYEQEFLKFIEKEGFGGVSKLIKTKWYKDTEYPPTEIERLEFMFAFSKSYDAAPSGSP